MKNAQVSILVFGIGRKANTELKRPFLVTYCQNFHWSANHDPTIETVRGGGRVSNWQKIGVGLFVAGFLWLMVTNAIFQLSNPEVTQTQALFHIVKTVTLDFKP